MNKSFSEKITESLFTNVIYYFSCIENMFRANNINEIDDNVYIKEVVNRNNVTYTYYNYKNNQYIYCNNKAINLNLTDFKLSEYKPSEQKILAATLIDNEIEIDVTDIIIKYGGHSGDFHNNHCFFYCSDIIDDMGQNLVTNNNTLKIISFMGDDYEYKKEDIVRI